MSNTNDNTRNAQLMAEIMAGAISAIDGAYSPGYASKNPALVGTLLQSAAAFRAAETKEGGAA